jgi:hypothetical protein
VPPSASPACPSATGERARHPWGRLLLPLSAAMVAACVAAPVLATGTVPLFDYANHLSRAHVIAGWTRSATFQAWFEPSGFLIPNVLADLLLVALTHAAGAETAGRVLLLTIAATTLGGALALGRASAGRVEIWPLFVAVFLYNEMLLWGFLNYTLGLGVLLWGIAAWLGLEGRSRRLQLSAGVLFALATFFSHLVAFGLFAIAVATLELSRAVAGRVAARPGTSRSAALRRLAASAGIFAPAAALFFGLSPSSSLPAEPRFNFAPFHKLSPLTRVLASGEPVTDTAVLLGVLILFAAFWATGRLALDRRLGLVAAAFLLALVLLPYSALQSFFIDSRIAVAAVFVALPALRSRRPRRGTAGAGIGVAGLVLLMAVRTAALTQQWSVWDDEYRRIVAAFDLIPRGSVLIAASAAPFEYAAGWFSTRTVNPPHEHTASYATIRRDVIVPGIFAKRGQNPLVFSPPSRSIAGIALGPIPRVGEAGHLRRLAYRASAVRSELDGAGLAHQDVYVVAFHVKCADWPTALPMVAIVCAEGFSIMEVQRYAPLFLARHMREETAHRPHPPR